MRLALLILLAMGVATASEIQPVRRFEGHTDGEERHHEPSMQLGMELGHFWITLRRMDTAAEYLLYGVGLCSRLARRLKDFVREGTIAHGSCQDKRADKFA